MELVGVYREEDLLLVGLLLKGQSRLHTKLILRAIFLSLGPVSVHHEHAASISLDQSQFIRQTASCLHMFGGQDGVIGTVEQLGVGLAHWGLVNVLNLYLSVDKHALLCAVSRLGAVLGFYSAMECICKISGRLDVHIILPRAQPANKLLSAPLIAKLLVLLRADLLYHGASLFTRGALAHRFLRALVEIWQAILARWYVMPLLVHQTVPVMICVEDGHLRGWSGLDGSLASLMTTDAGNDAVHALPRSFIQWVLLMCSPLLGCEPHFFAIDSH